jgi:hypothetical protein
LGSKAGVDDVESIKLLNIPGLEPRPLGRRASSHFVILTALTRILSMAGFEENEESHTSQFQLSKFRVLPEQN